MIINLYRIFFLLLIAGLNSANAALVANIGGDYVNALAAPTNWEYRYFGGLESSGALTADRAIGDLGHRGFGIPFTPPSDPMTSILGKKTNTANDFKIFASSTNGAIEGTDLLMHPGHYPGYSVLARFTFTAAMIASNGNQMSTTGSFRRLATQEGSVVVCVFLNDNFNDLLWTRNSFLTSGGLALTQEDGTFNLSDITVNAGDTISFLVDSNGAPDFDETALRGTISLVPEPAGYALLLGSAILLGALYLRRRA